MYDIYSNTIAITSVYSATKMRVIIFSFYAQVFTVEVLWSRIIDEL